MGAGYFVIAIMGCADGSTACTPVATMPTHYATEAECSAATTDALAASTSFDFPTLRAQCRAGSAPANAAVERPKPVPAAARKG